MKTEGIELAAYANVSNSLAPTGGIAFTAGDSQDKIKKAVGGLKVAEEF